jgi:hypothetical protein
MNKILDVAEDIKQNITDNQYKILMESLMEINNNGNKLPLLTTNHKLNKIACLFNWLDTKLKINDDQYSYINRIHLQKYVITNYFDNCYYENIDLVKQLLKIYFKFSTKEQVYKQEYRYVEYRNRNDHHS